ncbi:MAG: SCO family protein [Proteobacteria bacterium]|nr:SCO family protein [Pseudomonadota bacterium]
MLKSLYLTFGLLTAVAQATWPHAASAAQASTDLAIGGPFALTTQKGTRLTDADLRGKPYALFFGFTHCPEVCPTTLFELAGAVAEIGPAADGLNVVFVTVDPERDTPEYLASYLGTFDQRFIGLRGTPDEIATVARAFKATYRKVPLEGDDYTMDHTAIVYLMDAEGRYVDRIEYLAPHEVQVEKLKRLLGAGK